MWAPCLRNVGKSGGLLDIDDLVIPRLDHVILVESVRAAVDLAIKMEQPSSRCGRRAGPPRQQGPRCRVLVRVLDAAGPGLPHRRLRRPVPGSAVLRSANRRRPAPGPWWLLLPGSRDGLDWSAWWQGLQPADGGGYLAGPGPVLVQAQASAAADEPAGGGQQARPEPLGLPAASGPGEGEQPRPGGQVAGQGGDLASQLVLGEVAEGKVPQAGVLGAADPVLASGPAPLPWLQVGELALTGVRGEGGEPAPSTRRLTGPWTSPILPGQGTF